MADAALTTVSFTYHQLFDWTELQNCAPYENILGEVFSVRRGVLWHSFQLAVAPKGSALLADDDGEAESKRDGFGIFLLFTSQLTDNASAVSVPQYQFLIGDSVPWNSQKAYQFATYRCTGSANVLPSLDAVADGDYVNDGYVRIGVSVQVDTQCFDLCQALSSSTLVPEQGVARELFGIIESDESTAAAGANFTIVCTRMTDDGQPADAVVFHVVKYILERLPYFHTLFSSDVWTENQEARLNLADDPNSVREVLRYLYLNEIDADVLRFPTLLDLATAWQVLPLRLEIERQMNVELTGRSKTNVKRIAECLQQAIRYDLQVAKKVCQSLLWDNWLRFRRSEQYQDMNVVDEWRAALEEVTDLGARLWDVTVV